MDPERKVYFLLKMGIFQPATCDRLPEGTLSAGWFLLTYGNSVSSPGATWDGPVFLGLVIDKWAMDHHHISLLNDEQMRNKIGVEHQPGLHDMTFISSSIFE